MHLKNFKKAFTLAETLLTLTIIGVIAAMTVPAMKDHSDVQTYIALTKKAYSSAQAATSALESKNGDLEFWSWSDESKLKSLYEGTMNTLPGNIENYATYSMDGNDWSSINSTKWFQTTDGMTWYISNHQNGKKGPGGAQIYGIIYVDNNGPKGPNRVGIDVHGFTVSTDGVNPIGDSIHDQVEAWSCTNYVIKHGKMPWYSDPSYASCSDERVYKK